MWIAAPGPGMIAASQFDAAYRMNYGIFGTKPADSDRRNSPACGRGALSWAPHASPFPDGDCNSRPRTPHSGHVLRLFHRGRPPCRRGAIYGHGSRSSPSGTWIYFPVLSASPFSRRSRSRLYAMSSIYPIPWRSVIASALARSNSSCSSGGT